MGQVGAVSEVPVPDLHGKIAGYPWLFRSSAESPLEAPALSMQPFLLGRVRSSTPESDDSWSSLPRSLEQAPRCSWASESAWQSTGQVAGQLGGGRSTETAGLGPAAVSAVQGAVIFLNNLDL